MSESVHGHEVMQMMVASGRSYTKEQLREEIADRFGPEARFHTCSRSNMSAGELIVFLESKGKFVESDGGFHTSPDRICSH